MIANGVLSVGVPPVNDPDLARPVFGQMSKRVVKLKYTFEALTVPRVRRSVLLAPAPELVLRYEYERLDESQEATKYWIPAET